tara:strand:- start:709 stop:1554 length:846 start_codon:yes stop_codon:yes gene_type:complete
MKNAESEKSTIRVIVHSFFVVPFLIAAFGVLIFFIWSLLTYESKSIEEYIIDIKVGGATKRWQSAYELSRLLNDKDQYPISDRVANEMLSAYEYALLDPNTQVRQYLIRAMGQTKDLRFLETIKSAIDQDNENVIADAVYALSFYNEYSNVNIISKLIFNSSSLVRNRVAVALGEMPKTSGTFALKDLLNDTEPNVRWNAAISLAKHGDSSGKNEILNLLDRDYLNKFESIDRYEKEQVLMIAVKISPLLNDKDIDKAVLLISQKDDNLKLRDEAMKALEL